MEPRFQGEGVRHILLSDSANCTVLRAVVLTQYRRVTDGRTDGQTDGIDVAIAMRAMQCAVKNGMCGERADKLYVTEPPNDVGYPFKTTTYRLLCHISIGCLLILYMYTVFGENGTTLFLPLTLPNAGHFQNSFTIRLSSEFLGMLL